MNSFNFDECVKIINRTPHPIHLLDEENNVIETFEKGDPIRLSQKTVREKNKVWGYIPISHSKFGEPENLPSWKSGYHYIVSQMVKTALPRRDDLLVPAEIVRDAEGNILGCRSLSQ